MAGIKYVNFEENREYQLTLDIMPKGQAGKIAVKLDDPKNEPVAVFEIGSEKADDFQQITESVGSIEGKHAVYFAFYAEGEGEICEFNNFEFTEK